MRSFSTSKSLVILAARSIKRRKAAKFLHDGVLYIQKKKGRKIASKGTKCIIYTQYLKCSVVAVQVLVLRFVRTREEQIKTDFSSNPTAGHMSE